MTRRRFLLHGLGTALAGFSFPLWAKTANRLPSLAALLRTAGPSIARVDLDGVSRSGVVLASRGLVLTVTDRGPVSAHVRVLEERRAARVVAFDRGLLMLSLPEMSTGPYPTAVVAQKAPRTGAWTAGLFTSTEGVQGSLGGLVDKGEDAWTFDLPVPRGSAVFDRNGSFLTVVHEQRSSRRCLAVPQDRVHAFLKDVRRQLT